MPQIPPNIQSVPVMPTELNRGITQNELTPSQGRILQNADLLWMEGRLRRGGGLARTQIEGRAVTVLNAFVATARQCKLTVLSYSNGTIYATCGDGTANCTGPLPLWSDAVGSGQSVNEDSGVPNGGAY